MKYAFEDPNNWTFNFDKEKEKVKRLRGLGVHEIRYENDLVYVSGVVQGMQVDFYSTPPKPLEEITCYKLTIDGYCYIFSELGLGDGSCLHNVVDRFLEDFEKNELEKTKMKNKLKIEKIESLRL